MEEGGRKEGKGEENLIWVSLNMPGCTVAPLRKEILPWIGKRFIFLIFVNL